ncbi:TRAP transporter large permease [Marinibacterium profundimaris]|uniref:TRAP transporter large permease protein n=1 Tax=Marinibacterium profundimaris TaxID=1679460 RepID=A0A225NBV9_9RHOB|nr:TRAP transporter large permease [Marinibacterium profundimaris]OWU68342.1 C4-dicarboxylate ABC transporter permease [Marinibacterium profundimaris]
MSIAVFASLFFGFVIVGVPIAFVLGLTSFAYILIEGKINLLIATGQRMVQGVNNFSLLAVPFFMLAGELMNRGGTTRRLIEFAQSVIGHLHGGLAYVNIIVSGFLSAIIGSANAVAAITSASIVPEMRRKGYSNTSASATSAAAATMGPIIPPSMVLIFYGVAANASIGDLFLAGVIPGLLLGAGFLAMAFVLSRRETGIEMAPQATLRQVLRNTLGTLPALSIPAIILGGIVFGVFTPTEAGAIACVIALFLGRFVYGELKWRDLPGILVDSGVVTAGVLFIAATAALFGWIMAIESIPTTVAQWMLAFSDNEIVIILMITLALLIIGLFLEPLAAILITVPVLMPVAVQLGIHPVQFGLLVSLNLVIGLITPPVGIVLFIISGITRVSVPDLCRGLLPYYLIAFIVLMLVTFVPQITMLLPSLF